MGRRSAHAREDTRLSPLVMDAPLSAVIEDRASVVVSSLVSDELVRCCMLGRDARGSAGPDRVLVARVLRQEVAVWRVFERLLREAADESYVFRAMVRPRHLRLGERVEQLDAMAGSEGAGSLFASTSRLCALIEICGASDGCTLMGVWYALERVRHDPEDMAAQNAWREWTQTLDAMEFDVPNRLAIVDAVRMCCRSLASILDDVRRTEGGIGAGL